MGDVRPLRVLVASHSHPKSANGGAEIAAYKLFKALGARGDFQAWFLGCDTNAGTERPGVVLSQPHADDEYVYAGHAFDWFKFANPDPRFPAAIAALFAEMAPDIVHFQHYAVMGLEVFQHLKRVRPSCRIVLTLHEYLAICHHFGQMVTTRHRSLCDHASPARCNKCFPEYSRSDFFLRQRYIERFFSQVDMFVSPSRFLADRYIAWGIPASRMRVLENLSTPAGPPLPASAAVPVAADGTLRIGFFGQVSLLKGIDVMFDAAAILAADPGSVVSLEIFGDYRGQPAELQTAFLARLKDGSRNIRFHGPYEQHRLDALMGSVHAVLVPSIWWENSPVVIQEALRNRRPVICSDIGGMAEKVRDGIDGFHFPAGNAMALASMLRRLAGNFSLLSDMAAKMPGRPVMEGRVEEFVDLYKELLEQS